VLDAQGFEVQGLESGVDLEGRLGGFGPDLVILDVMLPGRDGFELLSALRRHSRAAVLMLTARDSLADRVHGLSEGADDYLVKPFALAELLARVRALLRRDTAGTSAVVTVGALRLDSARHSATLAGESLSLTPKEFGVLEYLMTRPGHVVSSEELLEHVWDANADPFTQTVRVTVGTLRRKLGEGSIETLVGRGYRLREDQP